MDTNLLSDVWPFVRVIILVALFAWLFILICITSGRDLLESLALLVAFYGVCTMLGSIFAPNTVSGTWLVCGRAAVVYGWLAWVVITWWRRG